MRCHNFYEITDAPTIGITSPTTPMPGTAALAPFNNKSITKKQRAMHELRTKKHAMKAALILSAVLLPIGGCGGGAADRLFVEIEHAAVAPNPVPAPSASAPTSFMIQARVNGGWGVSVYVLGRQTLMSGSCGGRCDGQLMQFACTSALVATNAAMRELRCAVSAGRPVESIVLPVGTMNWEFYARSGDALDGVIPNSTDQITLPVVLN